MRLWRNHLRHDDGSSRGYEWFETKAEAQLHAEQNAGVYGPGSVVAENFYMGGRKCDLVPFLNQVAGYPDNG